MQQAGEDKGAPVALAAAEPDRIFLADHLRDIEIGCYAEEHGVTQKLRFNVWLEVPRFHPDTEDAEAAIVSYDLIVDAIDALIAGPRISLLETFAERLAADLLREPRVAAARIRIEKLDRVSGALGVEITRRRG